MILKKLIFVFAAVFLITAYYNAWCMSPQQSIMEQLKLISANRDNDEFLSLALLMFGPPRKMFRHLNYDVWFYPKFSTSLSDKPLKNVYLFIKEGKIVSIKTFSYNINPYTRLEVYP